MDLVVAGTDDAVMMVESEIQEMTRRRSPERRRCSPTRGMQPVIDAIIELAEHAAKEPFDFQPDDTDAIKAEDEEGWSARTSPPPTRSSGKGERQDAVGAAKAKATEALRQVRRQPGRHRARQAGRRVQGTGSRRRAPQHPGHRHPHRRPQRRPGPPDRRAKSASCRAPTARPCSPAARPRPWSWPPWAPATTSSSSTPCEGTYKEKFMLHYNFPPFSVGETGPHGRAGPPRNRPRQAGLAGDPPDAAGRRKTSPTPSAWSPRSPSPTAPPRWPRSAVPRWP